MHEKRNFIMVLMLVGAIVWAVAAWLFLEGGVSATHVQRYTSLILAIVLGVWIFYALQIEDKLPDHLRKVVGEYYYEADGLSFMPIIRVRDNQAELCVYYQNRFENPVETIVHLRPPPPGESFVIQPGMRDVHIAFRAGGGDFGVIHQPIAVPRNLQGQVIELKMAASSWFPRSRGQRWRRRAGIPAGTLPVDWVGNPLKVGVHEVSDEIPLTNPVTLHLTLPENARNDAAHADIWRQEQLSSGAALVT